MGIVSVWKDQEKEDDLGDGIEVRRRVGGGIGRLEKKSFG
jgi:hypothetical protein